MINQKEPVDFNKENCAPQIAGCAVSLKRQKPCNRIRLFVSVFHLSRRTNFVYCWFSLSGRQSLYNINSCPKHPRYTWCCHCCPSPSLTSSNAVSNTPQSIIISKERPISTFSNIWPVVYRFTDDKIFSVTNPFLELSVNSAKTNSARATRPGLFYDRVDQNNDTICWSTRPWSKQNYKKFWSTRPDKKFIYTGNICTMMYLSRSKGDSAPPIMFKF